MAFQGQQPAGEYGRNGTSPKGGKKRAPIRSLGLAVGAVLFLALALTAAAVVLAPNDGPTSASPAVPAAGALGPDLGASLDLNAVRSLDEANEPAEDSQADGGEVAPGSATAQDPETVASSWSVSPSPVPPAPAPPAEPASVRLVREAADRFGVRIVLEGQDWGADELSQAANIGAVISAMERLPSRVASSVAQHPHGPLTFASNRQGRTAGGWQPYGDFPMAYYTNSDVDGPSNQVVLIPGSSDMTIGHEIMHAYQFRNVGPDQYALALLSEEMQSFMAATGWRQLGTDDQVTEAVGNGWDVINGLFAYEGRALTYVSVAGTTVTLTPPNPLEAFAVAGSVYYTRPQGMAQPGWPEYWAWFDQNLG